MPPKMVFGPVKEVGTIIDAHGNLPMHKKVIKVPQVASGSKRISEKVTTVPEGAEIHILTAPGGGVNNELAEKIITSRKTEKPVLYTPYKSRDRIPDTVLTHFPPHKDMLKTDITVPEGRSYRLSEFINKNTKGTITCTACQNIPHNRYHPARWENLNTNEHGAVLDIPRYDYKTNQYYFESKIYFDYPKEYKK